MVESQMGVGQQEDADGARRIGHDDDPSYLIRMLGERLHRLAPGRGRGSAVGGSRLLSRM